MQKSDCIIGVEHVSKFFGDKAVLNDVNLSVRKGEFVTILGPSGCGKTTLLRLIAGFQTASEGVITIAGKDITQTPPHKRKHRVPEVRPLPPPQRVQQHCLRAEAEEAARCHHREEGKASPAHGGHDGL